MNRMGNRSDAYGSDGKQPRGFWAGLVIVRGFISRLVSLVSVTQEDLTKAGVYLRRRRD